MLSITSSLLARAVAGTAAIAALVPAGASARPIGPSEVVLHLRRPPYVAVHCPRSNTITCDRISIAAWPEGHPSKLVGSIAGRPIVMHGPSTTSPDGYWEGTLSHAGLLRPGPLQITPDSGRATWIGHHPRPVTVKLRASYSNRADATVVVHVLVRPGWG